MYSSAIKSVISGLSEMFIIDKYESQQINYYERKVKALYFRVTVTCQNYGYDSDYNFHEEWVRDERVVVHIIVTANHEVFSYVGDFNICFDIEKPELFRNLSNHNSCWKDSFRLHDSGWKLWNKCWNHDFIPVNDKQNMIESVNYNMNYCGSTLFKPVEVVHTQDDKSHNPEYFRKLISIQELNGSYIFESK